MIEVQKSTGIFLFTNEHLDSYRVTEYFGVVTGVSIQGVHMFRDALAYLSDKFGGRVHVYESSQQTAIKGALTDMAKQAQKVGANAIIGLRMAPSDVNGRMLMCQCYGTAVKIAPKRG